jgi:hypothetical protein
MFQYKKAILKTSSIGIVDIGVFKAREWSEAISLEREASS